MFGSGGFGVPARPGSTLPFASGSPPASGAPAGGAQGAPTVFGFSQQPAFSAGTPFGGAGGAGAVNPFAGAAAAGRPFEGASGGGGSPPSTSPAFGGAFTPAFTPSAGFGAARTGSAGAGSPPVSSPFGFGRAAAATPPLGQGGAASERPATPVATVFPFSGGGATQQPAASGFAFGGKAPPPVPGAAASAAGALNPGAAPFTMFCGAQPPGQAPGIARRLGGGMKRTDSSLQLAGGPLAGAPEGGGAATPPEDRAAAAPGVGGRAPAPGGRAPRVRGVARGQPAGARGRGRAAATGADVPAGAVNRSNFVWRNPAIASQQQQQQQQQGVASDSSQPHGREAEPVVAAVATTDVGAAVPHSKRPEALAHRAQRFARAGQRPDAVVPPSDSPPGGDAAEPPVFIGGGGGGGGGDDGDGDVDDTGAVTLGSGVIVGTCTDMCPPTEREMRSREGDLDAFERVSRDDKHTTTAELAVKRFTRTNARVPSLVRTPAALGASMRHLLSIIRVHGRVDFKGCYRFVWDRFRAVRVDITMQALGGEVAATMYEQMARFHILAANQLCEDAQSVANPEGFNSHLNVEQLMKCLASLFRIYDDVAARNQRGGGDAGGDCPNEPEFRAYHFLLSLDRHGKYRPDARETADQLRKLRPHVLTSRHVRLYLDAADAYRSCNWPAFFRLVAERATHLEACLLSLFFPAARASALRVINATYGAPGGNSASELVPLAPLAARTACASDEHLAAVAEHHGLTVIARQEDGALCLVPRDGAFVRPEAEFAAKREALVIALEPADLVASIETPPPLPGGEGQRAAAYAAQLTAQGAAAAQAAQAAALAAQKAQRERTAAAAAAQAAQARADADRAAQEERARAEAAARAAAAAEQEAKERSELVARQAAQREAEQRAAAAAKLKADADAVAAEAAAQQAAAEQRRLQAEREERLRAEAKAQAAARAKAEAEAQAAAAAAQRRARCQAALLRVLLRQWLHLWRDNASASAEERHMQEEWNALVATSSPSLRRYSGAGDDVARRLLAPIDVAALVAPRVSAACAREHAEGVLLPRLAAWKLLVRTCAAGTAPSAGTGAAVTASAMRGALSRGGVSADAAKEGVLSLYEAPRQSDVGGCGLRTLWVVIRDTDPTDAPATAAAALGASAVVFVYAVDAPASSEAQALAAMCASVTPGACIPLLVVVPTTAPRDGLPQKMAAMLHVAEAVAASRGGIGAARVVCCPPASLGGGDDNEALRQCLVDGIAWAASCVAAPPRVHATASPTTSVDTAVSAAIGVLSARQRGMAGQASPLASPEVCIAAFNAAVDATLAHVRRLYGLPAESNNSGDRHRTPLVWPPPELPQQAGGALPPFRWDDRERAAALVAAIAALRLPPWPLQQHDSTPVLEEHGVGGDNQQQLWQQIVSYLLRVAQADGVNATHADLLASCDAHARALLAGAGQHGSWVDILAPLLYQRTRGLDAALESGGLHTTDLVYLPPVDALAHAGEAAARAAMEATLARPRPAGAPGSALKRKAGEPLEEPPDRPKQHNTRGGSVDENAQPGGDVSMASEPLAPPAEAVNGTDDAHLTRLAAWDAAAAAAVGAVRAAADSYDSWLEATVCGGGHGMMQAPLRAAPAGTASAMPLSDALLREAAAHDAVTELLWRAAGGAPRR